MVVVVYVVFVMSLCLWSCGRCGVVVLVMVRYNVVVAVLLSYHSVNILVVVVVVCLSIRLEVVPL